MKNQIAKIFLTILICLTLFLSAEPVYATYVCKGQDFHNSNQAGCLCNSGTCNSAGSLVNDSYFSCKTLINTPGNKYCTDTSAVVGRFYSCVEELDWASLLSAVGVETTICAVICVEFGLAACALCVGASIYLDIGLKLKTCAFTKCTVSLGGYYHDLVVTYIGVDCPSL